MAEDINFFSHHGFDWGEIKIAVEEALHDSEAPRGASTITQQLVKNLWLSPSRNPLRKVKEAILTWQVERTLAKRRILEIYLNVAEFGPGIYGVGAAAQAYFGKAPADLGRGRGVAARRLAAPAGLVAPGQQEPGLPALRRRHPRPDGQGRLPPQADLTLYLRRCARAPARLCSQPAHQRTHPKEPS